MECLVSYLTPRARGYAHRDVDVSAATVRIGRGADSEIFLQDPRIALQTAEITQQPGGTFINATGPIDLRVNGQVQSQARLAVGDKVAIGPYDFEVVEPEPGKDIALTVLLARPLGNDLEELKARSRISLAETWLSRRRTAWLLFLAVAIGFLALPLASYFTKPAGQLQAFEPAAVHQDVLATWDNVWLSGAISGPHLFFGAACEACHQQPFVQVRDEACLNCHADIPQHADQNLYRQVVDARSENCQSCHKEHNGRQAIVLDEERFCASCHAGLEQSVSGATLLNAADFGTAHPEFRPTVVVDNAAGRLERIDLVAKDRLVERSGLWFPHDKHLKTKEQGGVRAPTGNEVMECASCHMPEKGGVGMAPVNMERDCARCHSLAFDPTQPRRSLPHGDPAGAQEMVRDFYARIALAGGYEIDQAAPAVVRRRPGTPIGEEERKEALAWATERADGVIRAAFGKAMCGYCHNVVENAEAGPTVEPVMVADRWLPKGVFDHEAHRDTTCESCHAARESKAATDVLLPGIASCRECHGGETATDKVPSTCVMCHQFHVDGMPAMSPHGSSAALDWRGPPEPVRLVRLAEPVAN